MFLNHKRNVLALACGIALAGPAGATDGDLQARWRDYARQRIAPGYTWSGIAPAEAPTALSAFRAASSHGVPGSARSAAPLALERLGLRLSGEAQRQPLSAPSQLGVLDRGRNPIANEFVASTVDRQVGEDGRFSVSAILARQRYASAELGLMPWDAPTRLEPVSGALPHESSSGTGVRVGFSDALSPRLSWNIALQSRLDMEPFKSYRGIYSDPGDFDVPARAELGVAFALTPKLQLGVAAERVFYSDTDAFTSAALPSRFLSLLGDGTSPAFAWRDLTVYSAEVAFRDGRKGEWSLRYTTRQQPSPTSRLLHAVLEPEFTDLNLAAGYSRSLGGFGTLMFAASYAPATYFLGAAPFVQSNYDGGSQVEVEALWTIPF
jgi:hypothetical protein